MKVVFIKSNNFIEHNVLTKEGYKFIPRRNDINFLFIYNKNLIGIILNKKISKELNRLYKTTDLIISSNYAIYSDCLMMINELRKTLKLIINKYITYIDEFDFFYYIKKIYVLEKVLELKKNLLNEVI